MDDVVPSRMNGLNSNGRNMGRTGDARNNGKQKKTKKQLIAMAIGSILLVAALAAGSWFFYQSSTTANIDNSKYQAVFLTNGQVYFGKLQMLNGNYIKLTDVYYLQAQTTDTTADLQATTKDNSSDVQLIKLGNEIHGPSDEMIISKDQMLFFENLKKDGKVASSIAAYRTKK